MRPIDRVTPLEEWGSTTIHVTPPRACALNACVGELHVTIGHDSLRVHLGPAQRQGLIEALGGFAVNLEQASPEQLQGLAVALGGVSVGAISDGHHTFDDLYDHRRALTAVLAMGAGSYGDAWRSKAHHPEDGPMFDGCFIVGIKLPTGTITYHYPIETWDDFADVPELEHAEKWDGAGPAETVERLLALVRAA